MTQSSYQVQRLLARLRRLGRWLTWPAHRPWAGVDAVQTTAAAKQAAHAAADAVAERGGSGRSAVLPSVAAVRDPDRYEAVVEAERERRAGSFMQPPYPPDLPAERIPKLPRTAAPRPRPRVLGEGD